MNDDVVAKINTIPPEKYLRISYYHDSGSLANMDQGWLKEVDLNAKTLTLESSVYPGKMTTVWIDNIRKASDIDDTHTGSGAAGPALAGAQRYTRGKGWLSS